jgi:hypothetical protein
MGGELLKFVVHHQLLAVISPKPPFRIGALTAAPDPNASLKFKKKWQGGGMPGGREWTQRVIERMRFRSYL